MTHRPDKSINTHICTPITISNTMATLENGLQDTLNNLPFPAATRQVAGLVDGVKTDVMVMSFSDKIMVTISQQGRLAHWVGLIISA